MVFPGKFSSGCLRCRKRKVKCDEGKPSCRRCHVYGEPCPGYTDQFHFRYNRPNSTADAAAESQSSPSSDSSRSPSRESAAQGSPRRRSSSQSSSSSQPIEYRSPSYETPSHQVYQYPPGNESAIELSREQAVIAPRIDLAQDDVSLFYFVNRFVSPGGMDGFPGHLNFLPALFNSTQYGVLEMATLSVAQMAAYNQFKDERFRLESYKNYGRSVNALQAALQCDEEAKGDRVLATVLLLCVFKDISNESPGNASEHASGIYYLLAKRGVEQLATSTGFELLIFALMRLQVYSFVNDDDTYNDPGGVISLLGMFDPMIRAMAITSRILRLRHTISIHIASSVEGSTLGTDEQQNQAVFQACLDAFQELDDWEAEAPTYWEKNFHGRTAPVKLGQVGSGNNHYDPETACTIILIRTARLILLSSMYEYFVRVEDSAINELLVALAEDIRLTIDDTLACVPYAMGDVDSRGQPAALPHDGAGALVILQSMRLVTYCSFGNPTQVQTAQNLLNRIHSTLGMPSAEPTEEKLAVCKIGVRPRACLT